MGCHEHLWVLYEVELSRARTILGDVDDVHECECECGRTNEQRPHDWGSAEHARAAH